MMSEPALMWLCWRKSSRRCWLKEVKEKSRNRQKKALILGEAGAASGRQGRRPGVNYPAAQARATPVQASASAAAKKTPQTRLEFLGLPVASDAGKPLVFAIFLPNFFKNHR
jgi:hypothetical protein